MKTFQEYHDENPQVYDQFKTIAWELIENGRTHYGAKGIIEIIRYNTYTKAKGYPEGIEFKINNNYAPDYARLFMESYPLYRDFFKTRELKKARN